MKKHSKSLFLLLISSFALLGACSPASTSSGLESVPYEEEPNVKETSVYLGLFETKTYSPDDRLDFKVEVMDTSVVTYEEGAFKTNLKEGETLAKFVSNSFTYNVTVTVRKDATVPLFTTENQEISVYKGTTFALDTFLSYRDIDVNDYEHTVKVTKETSNGSSRVNVNGNSLAIEGLETGNDVYTVYTEFAGFTLSKSLSVSVKNNNGLVVCGKSLVYDNLGPHYTISMYRYSEHKINLQNDIRVLKGGVEVPYSNLVITFHDPSSLSLENGYLMPYKSGKTYFTIRAGEETITVNVEIVKPVLGNYNFSLSDEKFDLDMTVLATAEKRTFTANSSMNKVIPLTTETSYQNVTKLVVNEKEIPLDASKASYDASKKEVKLNASLFSIENYGRQKVTVYLDASEFTETYTCTIDFATKYLSTYADMSKYFTQKSAKDVIYGQYILKNDLDGEGREATGSWVSLNPINYSCGFRGIFDGAGHKIKNYKSSLFGFFILIGNGAVIKNVTFDDVHYSVKESGGDRGLAMLGRFISGATFDNITINLASDSVTTGDNVRGGKLDSTGLLCTEIFTYNVVRNMTVHAEGFEMASIFGKQIPSTTFYNVNIYCKSLSYIGSDQSAVEGVTIHKD